MTDKSKSVKNVKYVTLDKSKSIKSRPVKQPDVNLLDDNEYDNNYDQNKTVRLSSTKYKPPATVTGDRAEDIKEKLKFYKRVDSDKVRFLPIGTKIKYVEVLDDGKFKFKTGGSITVNKAPVYLVLIANRKTWSVQLDKHIIFEEEFDMIRKDYEDQIEKLNNHILKLQNTIINLNDELHEIKGTKKRSKN